VPKTAKDYFKKLFFCFGQQQTQYALVGTGASDAWLHVPLQRCRSRTVPACGQRALFNSIRLQLSTEICRLFGATLAATRSSGRCLCCVTRFTPSEPHW
jgi:hypothetical protein